MRSALAGIRDDFLHQGHSAEQFLKIEMVLAEALNNIAEHGGPGVHNSPITIKWQYEQGLFSATLKDNGRPFPTAAIPDRGVQDQMLATRIYPRAGSDGISFLNFATLCAIKEALDKISWLLA